MKFSKQPDISTFAGIINKAEMLVEAAPFKKARMPGTGKVVAYHDFDLSPVSQAWAIKIREVFGRPFGHLVYSSFSVSYNAEQQVPVKLAELRWQEYGSLTLKSTMLTDPNRFYVPSELDASQLTQMHAYLSLPMALIGVEVPASTPIQKGKLLPVKAKAKSFIHDVDRVYDYDDMRTNA